ncbi:FAD binding domain-containing protein [Paraburkholderia strydomiana]|uniref:FAD binding domain-containing protein n=1 Tax=Paraburkholderia strydomiana TaxID=1245417 RepID=UPI001BE67113|nr:FAD binding domain-containing protein [Paraburkholderia strydomiana]MBT2793899.1 FAD binding domain-containing protein [Paraburkholderia strydomiana]
MKAAAFEYVRAASLPEALREFGDSSIAAKPISGSQSMGPMLNLRLARPPRVVDVSRVDELRSVTAVGDMVRIGAAITHAEIEDGKYELLRNGFMQYVASGIAYRAIRNRGTMGGSLAHADPAADWPLALATLDARIELVKTSGRRQVRASEFMLGAFTTLLEEGEIISAIFVPKIGVTLRWGYYKLCRKTGEFPHASASAAFDAQTGLARIVVGALDGPPTALDEFARSIAKHGPSAATAEAIATGVASVMPNADAIDRSMHEAAVERCLAQAFGSARG